MTTYTRYGEKNDCKCLVSMDGYFNCRKNAYKMRDFPLLATKGMDDILSSSLYIHYLKDQMVLWFIVMLHGVF